MIAKPDIQERIVKVELTYYRTTHKTDMLSRPDLFRLNKITHKERLENLLILLSDDDMATGSLADLPTDADAFAIVQGNSVAEAPVNSTADLNTNDNCVVAWCIYGTWNWYVGYVKEMLNDEQYIADHLERLRPGNSAVWKYPTIDDTKTVFRDQIVPIQMEIGKLRKMLDI